MHVPGGARTRREVDVARAHARPIRRRRDRVDVNVAREPLAWPAACLEIARPGGAVGRVWLPQEEAIPGAVTTFFSNLTISGGPAPARAYIEQLLPDVLEGRIKPGRVFDRSIGLDDVPDGYRAMDERESIKALIEA